MPQKKINIAFVLLYLAIFVAVGFGIFFLVYYTNGLKSDIHNLRVSYGSQNIYNNSSMTFETNKNIYIQCDYNFGTPQNVEKKYSLSVSLSRANKFDFKLGDSVNSSQVVGDLTEYLNVAFLDNAFVIFFDNDTTMLKILQAVYKDYDVSLQSDIDIYNKYYFDMTVSSYDLKEQITFSFRLLKGVRA